MTQNFEFYVSVQVDGTNTVRKLRFIAANEKEAAGWFLKSNVKGVIVKIENFGPVVYEYNADGDFVGAD